MLAKCIVENCVSKITVNSGTYAGGLIGGILFNAELEIRNCAVLSDVNIFRGYGSGGGGVIGYSKGKSFTAEQVYFGGVMGGSDASTKDAFVYEKRYNCTPGNVTAVFYDTDKNPKIEAQSSYSSFTGKIIGKTSAELKDLDSLSLTGFTVSGGLFDGYPVPSWLTTLGAGPHTVTVTAEGASKVTLTKDSVDTKMTAAGEGMFTASLAEGQYTYTAETSLSGKDTATGTLVVGKVDKAMTITLPDKVADTVITVTGSADASLTVYKGSDANGTLMQEKSAEKGVYTYALQAGSYYYEATAEEYETASGKFTVPVKDSELTVTMTASPKYDVTFNISSGEKTPSVKVFRGGKIYQPEARKRHGLCTVQRRLQL